MVCDVCYGCWGSYSACCSVCCPACCPVCFSYAAVYAAMYVEAMEGEIRLLEVLE